MFSLSIILISFLEFIIWNITDIGQVEGVIDHYLHPSTVVLKNPYLSLFLFLIGIIFSANGREFVKEKILSRINILNSSKEFRVFLRYFGSFLIILVFIIIFILLSDILTGGLSKENSFALMVCMMCITFSIFICFNLPDIRTIE